MSQPCPLLMVVLYATYSIEIYLRRIMVFYKRRHVYNDKTHPHLVMQSFTTTLSPPIFILDSYQYWTMRKVDFTLELKMGKTS